MQFIVKNFGSFCVILISLFALMMLFLSWLSYRKRGKAEQVKLARSVAVARAPAVLDDDGRLSRC